MIYVSSEELKELKDISSRVYTFFRSQYVKHNNDLDKTLWAMFRIFKNPKMDFFGWLCRWCDITKQELQPNLFTKAYKANDGYVNLVEYFNITDEPKPEITITELW